MNNINNKQKVTYCDTDYQDFADYNGSLKKLWESQMNSAKEIIERSWKNQWKPGKLSGPSLSRKWYSETGKRPVP